MYAMAAILYVLVAVAFALFALSMHVERSRSRIADRLRGNGAGTTTRP